MGPECPKYDSRHIPRHGLIGILLVVGFRFSHLVGQGILYYNSPSSRANEGLLGLYVFESYLGGPIYILSPRVVVSVISWSVSVGACTGTFSGYIYLHGTTTRLNCCCSGLDP